MPWGDTVLFGHVRDLESVSGVVSGASVLVRYEPTVAREAEAEKALVPAFHAERQKRVVIAIAHRLSTIRTADRICVVDNGKIVESGSHEELMKNPEGAYRRFVELQLSA